MTRARRSWTIGAVALSMLAASAIALADDSLVNIGYDQDNHMLLLNTSPTDSTFDCTLQGEEGTELVAGYTSEDGVITVETLQTKDAETEALAAFMFMNRPGEAVSEDFDVAEDPAEYTGPDGPCALSAGVVAGPNGQINHGQVMKAFHQLFDMRGKGCINRLFAQSDLGKGDQQLKTDDVDPDFAIGKSGTLEFMTFVADCGHGKKEKGDDHPSSKAKMKGDSPGKSGSAKGSKK